ncbi:MAG: tetratricopeptide repeat protein [Planctomycetota bacterium]|nr:tetratricopeptide repeat protein [Planctomycetota bacterium]
MKPSDSRSPVCGPRLCSSAPRLVLLCLCVFASSCLCGEPKTAEQKGSPDDAKMDYKANDILNKGVELLDQPQNEERAIKLLQSVPQLFPKSKVRFKAYLTLGQHLMKKRSYELAIKQFEQLGTSENPDEQAEGLYRLGVCHFLMSNYDKAFMALRRVTNQFPWSVYANEAYYYIGQCHFKLNRWVNAVEALEMVGTSVPLNAEGETSAEAGQRLFVKIHDKDLVVLLKSGDKLKVQVAAKSGDKEEVVCEPLGKSGEYFIGSIQTQPGKPSPGDGILEIIGGDVVTVDYIDENTEENTRNVKRLAIIKMVSTAMLGFTDGAYKEYTKGVFGDSEAFVRLKDLDRDTTDQPDEVTVRVQTQYTVKKEQELDKGVALGEPESETKQRDAMELKLVENGLHTGLFTGAVKVALVKDDREVVQGDSILSAMQGDEIVASYYDDANLAGGGRDVKASARILSGRIADVVNQVRVLTDLDKKARKDLIEAKIFLKLGQIFKDVGLVAKANEKADMGLSRVNEVIRTSTKASLSREVVEEAYSVEWELLLVQDKLREAISVCRTLTERFPDSTLVDKALLKIGQAKMAAKDYDGALQVFAGILNLPKSTMKAEAQFNIAQIEEQRAVAAATGSERPPVLSGAMMAYKRVADAYPDSPFAGEALDKIANYYIQVKDFDRAMEMMQQVFQDYEDAPFLDRMLLKWVIAAYRGGKYQLAKDKLDELLNRYPNSASAEKAREFAPVIAKKLAGGKDADQPPAKEADAPAAGAATEKTEKKE